MELFYGTHLIRLLNKLCLYIIMRNITTTTKNYVCIIVGIFNYHELYNSDCSKETKFY